MRAGFSNRLKSPFALAPALWSTKRNSSSGRCQMPQNKGLPTAHPQPSERPSMLEVSLLKPGKSRW
uniref:Secreted protein n=1 Tax=Mesocestoides corti TaxID=53468 RepID=A0A5K3G5U1_MESCO